MEMDLVALNKDLDRAMISIMQNRQAGFFSALMFHFPIKWDEKCGTAYTNGLMIGICPKFFSGLVRDSRAFLILHEILHIALQHTSKTRKSGKCPRKWNVACDYAINSMLIEAGFKMPDNGLYDPKYKGMTEEAIYDALPDDPNQQPDFNDIQGESGGSEDEEGKGRSLTPEEITILNGALTQAATEAHLRGCGSIPSNIAIYLNSLIAPKLPWQRILKNTAMQILKQDYSFHSPNRRYLPDHYLPSLYSEHMGEIVVAVDTSGSVSDSDFNKFVSETAGVVRMLKPSQLRFIQFESDIVSEDVVKSVGDLSKLSFNGRGGTCFAPVAKRLEAINPKAVIVFTDGYFKMPRIAPSVTKNFIWVIYGNPSFTAPKGKVIDYDHANRAPTRSV